jgi:hypothetical protein
MICAVTLVAVTGFAYYFLGAAGQPGTHSYFLEQRLRHLLFLETHEPVDYARTLADYERILPRVRFGADTNSPTRYRRAVARTKLTLEILAHLRRHATTGDAAALRQARQFYRSVFSQNLDDYGFYSLYLDHVAITEEWFRNESIKAGLSAESF